ncbi:unnamed protein product, partial [Hapterophycus canaliculatus]
MEDSPSASPTDCSGDPVPPYWQCGGDEWQGSTCCEEGFECVPGSSWYSQVRSRRSRPPSP